MALNKPKTVLPVDGSVSPCLAVRQKGGVMSDLPFQHAFSNTNQAPSPRVGRDDGRATGGRLNKLFRRRTARHTVSPLVALQPTSSVLVPYRRPDPSRIEWDKLRRVTPGVRRHFLSGAPLVNFFRRDPAAQAIDLLRTQLMQALRENGWGRIAIAAPTHGCGATFTAVNLAQSLARLPGNRTVLMDLNQRTPGIATMLEMDNAGEMHRFLSGEVPIARHLVRVSDTLALGLTAGPHENATETLLDGRCTMTLNRMAEILRPDVVLYDLPPILAYDDLAGFLPQVDGVLLVTDGTRTTASQIKACERVLEGQTQLLGVVLNRARQSGE